MLWIIHEFYGDGVDTSVVGEGVAANAENVYIGFDAGTTYKAAHILAKKLDSIAEELTDPDEIALVERLAKDAHENSTPDAAIKRMKAKKGKKAPAKKRL